MPKSKTEKKDTVAALVSGIKSAKGVVFANFQGLTVAQTEALRKECRQANITVLAAKKTLVKRALEEVGLGDVATNNFKGGVAAFMGQSDEIAPAKVIATFAKKAELVTFFGGILEGKFIDAAMVKSLSALPSKLELLTKMVGSLNAPILGFVNVNAGIVRSLLNVLNNLQKAKA
ncbi:MAG: 50S ribosomal protein L10 [Candidatus Magasanikbacteria bacterium]|nr:50S ribosomal protein L10 [Candidatus Magasanikbacteria bacterium]